MRIYAIIYIYLSLVSRLYAGEVLLTSSVDKALINTGDLIKFTIQVTAPEKLDIVIPEFGGQIEGFRIVDFENPPSTSEDGLKIQSKIYNLQADITGTYILPEITISYFDSEEKKQVVSAAQIFVEVESLLNNKDGKEGNNEKGDIKDIKGIIYSSSELILIGLVIFGIILLLGAVYAFMRWKRGKGKEEKIIPPHQLAKGQLQQLKGLQFKSAVELKRFHFELSNIIRLYFEGRYQFAATDRTSEEIKKKLTYSKILTEELKTLFISILQKTDVVKFTDMNTTSEAGFLLLDETERFIDQTKPAEVLEDESVI